MIKEIIRHPITHIALALATGLPLVACTPRPDNANGSRNPTGNTAVENPNNNVITKATLLPEVINQANAPSNPGKIKAFNNWFGRFNRDLLDSSKMHKIRFTIASHLPVKGRPFTAEDLIAGLVPIDQTVLTVNSAYSFDSPTGNVASRMLGVTEVRGIRVEYNQSGLTLEQQANGGGVATVRFLVRGTYSIWEGKDTLSHQATAAAKAPGAPSLSPSVPWRERERIIDLARNSWDGFGGNAINEALITPINVAVGCGKEILGYGGEQTCVISNT